MKIENINGLTKLIADENKYITTAKIPLKDNEIMLAKIIYLGKNDSVENYVEIEDNDFPVSLGNKLKSIDETNKNQDKLINKALSATNDIYTMLEPLLAEINKKK